MNTSATTLPPAGQPHDRDDAVMEDSLTNGLEPPTADNTPNTVAVEIAPVPAEEDSTDPNGVTHQESAGNDIQPPAPAADLVR